MYAIGALKAHMIKGDSARAIIEPTETYLVKNVTTAQIAAIINPTCQFSARIVPTPDATDFPPVNFKNTDLLCPKITAIAANTGKSPIPVNTVAEIFLPVDSVDAVRESGRPIKDRKDMTVSGICKGKVNVSVGSGEYEFVIK